MYMYIVVLSLTNIKSNQYCILETKKYGDRNRVLTKLIATLPGGGFSTLDPDVFQSFFFSNWPRLSLSIALQYLFCLVFVDVFAVHAF